MKGFSRENEIITITKNILIESEAFKDQDYYNPEMFYLVSLYIMESVFDFYSEELFKFLLYNGINYFKTQRLSREDKNYLLIFEKETKNFTSFYSLSELEILFLDLIKNEKKKIIEKLKNVNELKTDEKISYIVKKLKEKRIKKIKFEQNIDFNDITDLLDF